MRRVHVSHTRSRSRSRSPLLRGPRPLVSKSHPVNMLDKDALLAVRAKKESKPFTPKERITCTIDGPRRSGALSSRIGGFGDRRRSEGDRLGGFQNRQSMRDRLSFSDRHGRDRFEASREPDFDSSRFNGKFRDEDADKPVQRLIDPTAVPKGKGYFGSMRDRLSFSDRHGRDRFEASREPDFDSSRFNGKFRDEDADKPVQRLIDPTAVPKGKSYFGHDDRGEERQWRGRNAYDPRIDMGPRRDRLSGFRGYYGRDRDRYDRRDRDGPRRSFGPRSAADGLWTHDKFIELEGDEGFFQYSTTGSFIL
ncbi:hypothetical protein OESDEN_07832 [Oesophagostomum dentatum]|uniref:Btz domain-containing protein n=1 Tax=Oesophagostomum dentatum TaxID=61180 RepID=A0A0B1T4W5_OESDE|nr:hypothetical protein OESDEN_07832 [Oesophagostomum dentatum]